MLPRRSAVDVLSFITPPNIALAVLLRLYAEQNAGDASDAWLHLALYLVEEVKSADQCYEKPIDEIYDDIRGLDDSGDVEAGLQAALGELQSPDDLFTFLHELQHLLTEEVEQVVESDSGPAPLGAGKRLFFPDVNRFCMALLYGRAGRLTAKNGGFRPGQSSGSSPARLPWASTRSRLNASAISTSGLCNTSGAATRSTAARRSPKASSTTRRLGRSGPPRGV
jgi:hypothetical protein